MNNRQAGRRRGRGGQRSQGNPNQGNRIDNRARGNATQLHEKYKNLARDAQMAGDRVNTEYYLQFADHYFRVLNESRSRFEEQNARRQRDDGDADDMDDTDVDGEIEAEGRGQSRDRDDHRVNGRSNGNRSFERDDDAADDEEEDRRPRERAARAQRINGDDRDQRQPQEEAAAEKPASEKRGRGRPRREAQPPADAPVFDADRLPPSLGVSAVSNDDEAEEKPRRRRGRPPASEAAGSAN